MRLIDADSIPYTMLYREDWMRNTGVEAPAAWKEDIDALPTVTVEELETGKWEEHHVSAYNSIGLYVVRAKCSVCGRYSWQTTVDNKEISYNFCPRCGAYMRTSE